MDDTLRRMGERAIKAVHVALDRNPPKKKSSAERVKRWRKAHPEEHRKRHAKYMRKYRSK